MWKKIKDFFLKNNRGLIMFLTLLLFFGFYLNYYSEGMEAIEEPKEITYNEFLQMIENKEVKSVEIDLNQPLFGIIDNNEVLYYSHNPKTANFKEFLLTNDVEVIEVNFKDKNILISEIFNTLRFILLFGFGIFLFRRMLPNNRQDEIVENIPQITFDNLAGSQELKKDMQFVVNYLKDSNQYIEMGARMPRGIVLYGPPGTGKTLTAKAIAGTAGVPFFSVSGSDFVEMFVGLGAKRVRDLYKKAKRRAPCIVFIDEIDAVGTSRGVSNNSEKDQTINALLNELDGFSGGEGVITICATNRIEDLDPALIRPGRFDKHIAIQLPEKDDRLAILNVHAKNKKFAKEINLKEIASMTVGFSGAALEALLNEAAFIAVNEKKEYIDTDSIDKAFYRQVMKGDKKENHSSRDKEELRLVAYHEAGHALATKLLTDEEVPKVTIISSTSGAGGVTFRTPKETSLYSRKYIRKLIQIMYAGRVGEYVLLQDEDELTTGASDDIKQATNLIKQYITTFGMSNTFGMINLNEFSKGTSIINSSDTDRVIKEASKMSNELYEEILKLLQEHKDLLKAIAEELLEKETLTNSQIEKIMSKFVSVNNSYRNIENEDREHETIVDVSNIIELKDNIK